ncbi:MAG: UDP-N-acetylmuramate:L-alanyl-gamma-D-glutamyl-meso-diaminopimelate ligase [Pseudomonadota bacterium]
MENNEKTIYLVGICGTAMGSFAGMLKEKGFNVLGSDINIYPPMSDQLEDLGIPVLNGYSAQNIPIGESKPDFAIIGNALSKGNVEAEEIINRKIEYSSFAKAFSDIFLSGKIPCVITGTHGKTTTTSLLAWILESAGLDPNMFVGGIPANFGKSYKLGKGDYFVVEGDEYDCAYFDKQPKFLHYKPFHAVITSIEYDHSDIYDSLDQIINEFKKFVKLVPENGNLVVCNNYQTVKDVIKDAKCKVITYGVSDDSDYTVKNVIYTNDHLEFDIYHKGKLIDHFQTNMAGQHNLMNILAAFITAQNLGISTEAFKEGLLGFKGIKRRLEVIGEINDIVLIDDFAHHPTAIETTVLACKKKYKNRRIWLIFEPRTNTTRRNIFEKELIEALSIGDIAIIPEVFKLEAIKEDERLSVDNVIKGIIGKNREAHYIPKIDDIVKFVCQESRANDVILIMSNGGFGGIYKKLLDSLKSKPFS